MAIFHPRKLADEMARPVSYADAEKFRRVTVWVLWAAGILFGASIIQASRREIGAMDWAAWMIVPASMVGWRLFLTSLTTSPSVFCRARSMSPERQNRAVALSLYLRMTCATACNLRLSPRFPVPLLATFFSPATIYLERPARERSRTRPSLSLRKEIP